MSANGVLDMNMIMNLFNKKIGFDTEEIKTKIKEMYNWEA